MELTQQDYEDRINRRAAGQNTDEDNRLIEHYEANGFSTRDDSAGKADGATLAAPSVGQGGPNVAETDASGGAGDDPRPVDDGSDADAVKAKKSTGRTTR